MTQIKTLLIFIAVAMLTACDSGSSTGEKSSASDSTTVAEDQVEDFIVQINEWNKKLLDTESVDDFVKIENESNNHLFKYRSSKASINESNRTRLVDAIVSYNRDSYLHRNDLEGRVLFNDEAKAITEMLENIKIDLLIKAEKAPTLGEFINSIINNQ